MARSKDWSCGGATGEYWGVVRTHGRTWRQRSNRKVPGAQPDTWKDLEAEERQEDLEKELLEGPTEDLQEGPAEVLQIGPAEEWQEGPEEAPQAGPEEGSCRARRERYRGQPGQVASPSGIRPVPS